MNPGARVPPRSGGGLRSLGLLVLMWCSSVHALEFRSAGEAPVVLRDAPSSRATRILVVSPGSPLEVLASIDGWVRVREHGGRLAWAEAGVLSNRRTVVVTTEGGAVVRSAAADTASPVFEARPGLLLELTTVTGVWAQVRHRDGLTGFVRSRELWGL